MAREAIGSLGLQSAVHCDHRGRLLIVSEPLRVAVTLEQLWHTVPGGTAVAACEVARAATADIGIAQIGVAAWHLNQPPEPWRSPVPIRHLLLPRPLLYESWHRLRWPPVQHATGPVGVIHATGMVVPPPSAPLVVTVHDVAWRRFPEHATARGTRFFERSLTLALRDATLLLASSEATAADLVRCGADPARLRVVPLGVVPRTVSAEARMAVRATYDLAGPFVLWTGTIEPRKNLPALVRAFTALQRDDVTLVLVGPKGWNEDLRALLAPIADNVVVPGFVPAAHLAALYAECAVFCYPSLLEGFGLPVLEALAQGAPVITSTGTSTQEVAGDSAILVDPTDGAALLLALREVLEDEALARRLAGKGPTRAAAFTWEQSAALTCDAYREAAAT